MECDGVHGSPVLPARPGVCSPFPGEGQRAAAGLHRARG
ncbi:hypothetical protein Rumeso_04488 [Rubellimicrobium mesophilum DSM 19309]|uniref:Uncharacterized protein n=1 Tax=Rubellimicrobium mesophilum DSM 19309 TaxID=442562 RepID=A0A017HHR2_9RHOB|nr:hypothetical protein Rumeso_04488 [Rubellimicrobium mesophilum DSM 19309]